GHAFDRRVTAEADGDVEDLEARRRVGRHGSHTPQGCRPAPSWLRRDAAASGQPGRWYLVIRADETRTVSGAAASGDRRSTSGRANRRLGRSRNVPATTLRRAATAWRPRPTNRSPVATATVAPTMPRFSGPIWPAGRTLSDACSQATSTNPRPTTSPAMSTVTSSGRQGSAANPGLFTG